MSAVKLLDVGLLFLVLHFFLDFFLRLLIGFLLLLLFVQGKHRVNKLAFLHA